MPGTGYLLFKPEALDRFLAPYPLAGKASIAARELTRHPGMFYRAAWRLKHKLTQAMCSSEATQRVGRPVQGGNVHPGGERNGGKPGRGSANSGPL